MAREVRKKVDGFAQYLPLIRCFLEESIREEDWQQIQKIVEPVIPPEVPFDREEISVQEYIVEFNLNQFVGEIEDVTMRAEKKFGLRKKLQEYRTEMKEFKIEQKLYKTGDTYILQNFDDIMAKLDEVIVGTQTMLGSSYMKGNLQAETKKWEGQLDAASVLMEAMIKTQRDWMYLEPIFASGDISETMPKEYKMFKEVDAHWRKTQEFINEAPEIMYLSEQDGLMAQFVAKNADLAFIQRQLAAYLEEKRLVFARFFFLGSDELLKILANTKDP